MGRVFVVQKPKPGPRGLMYDISPAIQYGQIVFIFGEFEQPGLKPGPSMAKARKLLQDFSDDDYVLWAGGDPAALAIVSLVLGEINHGGFQFLRWERERTNGEKTGRGFYMPVNLYTRI